VLSCTSASNPGCRFSVCRGCINILVKGFWFEKPGAKTESTATAPEILSLPLQVLLFNQKPLNKMLAATNVIALPLAGAPGG
jgi:hypothetical protein